MANESEKSPDLFLLYSVVMLLVSGAKKLNSFEKGVR